MDASAARLERLLKLITLLLNSERPVPFREIREHLDEYAELSDGAATRKFERDKASLLEDLGVPVTWVEPDPDDDARSEGGYLLSREAYFLPPLSLGADELALLYVAGAAARGMEGFPWPAEVGRALEKIAFAADESGAAPAAVARRVAVQVPIKGDPGRVGPHFAVLRDALARRKKVTLRYHALFSDEVTERRVHPYGLFLRDGTWCLHGFCELRGGPRTFHLDRIERLEVHAVRPRSPDYEIPAELDLAALARRRPWEFPMEPAIEVRLLLEPHVAVSARTLFGENARITPQDDGRAEVEVTTRWVEGLVEHVLSLRDAAVVLSPEPVRAQVRERLAALVARLEEGA